MSRAEMSNEHHMKTQKDQSEETSINHLITITCVWSAGLRKDLKTEKIGKALAIRVEKRLNLHRSSVCMVHARQKKKYF